MNRIKKRYFVIAPLIGMLLLLFCLGARPVHADSAPKLTAEKQGNVMRVQLLATELTNFYGYEILDVATNITYNTSVFSYSQADMTAPDGMTLVLGPNLSVAAPRNIPVDTGEPILIIDYHIDGTIQKNTDYVFSITVTDAFSMGENIWDYIDLWDVIDTFTVTYRENEYTVTFDTDGGSTAPDDQILDDDNNKATKPADPTKDGYTFQYWSTEKDGEEFDFDTEITEDTTLYAVWESDTVELKISNTVNGTPSGQTAEPVTYKIVFTAPAAGSVNPKDSDEDAEFAYEEEYEFTLGPDEEKTFTVPAGASYTITVTGTPNYETEVTVTSDGTAAAPVDNSANIGGDVTANGTVGGSGDNKVEVTNTYAITPLTGILAHRDMLIVIGLAALAIIGGLVISRKVRKV